MLGSAAAGGSGLGAAVGATGATSTAGGLAGLGVNAVDAAKASSSPRSLGVPAWHGIRPLTSRSSLAWSVQRQRHGRRRRPTQRD